MNTIDAMKQALTALKIADAFCGGLTANECPDTVHVPIRDAKSALESLAEAGLAVVVSRDENPDAMNRLYGEAYGVDWVYGDTKREEAQTVEQGQWVICSPALLDAGVSCKHAPRRENTGAHSHDHWISFAHPAPPPSGERAAHVGLLRMCVEHLRATGQLVDDEGEVTDQLEQAADALAADAGLANRYFDLIPLYRAKCLEIAEMTAQQVAVPQEKRL